MPISIIEEEEKTLEEVYDFDDGRKNIKVKHPAWFKENVVDLREALKNVQEQDKSALILYFGQEKCVYCDELIKTTVSREDVSRYTQQNFEVAAFDILSPYLVTDFKGEVLSQRELANREQANLTPAIVFYNKRGDRIFRLRGYYPPYVFRAALDYIVSGQYAQKSFSDYMQRGRPQVLEEGDVSLAPHPLFIKPPYRLNRLPARRKRLTAVFFEQPRCHACDIMHQELLADADVLRALQKMNMVQLNTESDMEITTPDGRETTVEKWAAELGVFYTPTLVFFENDKEVFRVDSVIRLYRLRVVMSYLEDKGYQEYPDNLQGWFYSGAGAMY